MRSRSEWPLAVGAVLIITGIVSALGMTEVLAQGPDAVAGPTGSRREGENVEVVAQIGGDVLAVAVEGDYLYAGEGPSLNVLDVSAMHRGSPQLVGRVGPLPGGLVRSVVVSDTLVYAVTDGCLWVVDVTDPGEPAIGGSFCPTWFSDVMNDVAVAGDYAYVAAVGYGLLVIRVSDPGHMERVGTFFRSTVERVTVDGGYAYVAAGFDGLRVLDVGTPGSPFEVGSYDPDGFWVSDVVVEGGYVYVAGGHNTGQEETSWDGVGVFDVSAPADPTLVGVGDVKESLSNPYAVAVRNGRAYLTDYNLGRLYLVDVSEPGNPSLTGYCRVPGHYALDVTVSEGYAYVADKERGVRAVNVSDPYAPTESGSYETLGEPWDVAVKQGMAYVADAAYGLRILDVGVPEEPAVEGRRQPIPP